MLFPVTSVSPLAGPRSSGTRLHPPAWPARHHGLRAATPYAQESATVHRAGNWCPRIPQPALLPTHRLRAPSLPGGPRGCPPGAPTASPHPAAAVPRPALAPLRMQYQPSRSCRTWGAPKPSLLFWGGVSPAWGTPNYLRPPGWVGARGRRGGRGGGGGSGMVASLSAETTSPFCISAGRWQGEMSPTRSLALAAGDRDGGDAPPLQVGLILFFFSLYNNNYYVVCF